MLHSVIQVKPTLDFKVYVYFDDGKIKLYDMNPLIGQGIFKQLSNVDDFMNKCTVINQTLAWDIAGGFNEHECIDIDPETIYQEGIDVADPLLDEGRIA
ncbi:MAG: DUF2442 domain-containing protein [Bdellovibrionales bacterium]|nr:DUF2442 domain-containing protein [Bdellovibrionales bacterium]